MTPESGEGAAEQDLDYAPGRQPSTVAIYKVIWPVKMEDVCVPRSAKRVGLECDTETP